jgi:hypothetical protein
MAKNTKHPYAAIEHRVMDSPAFADLTFSARALLFQLARQCNGINNGHLQATLKYLEPYGFSVNTITRGIDDLIKHGLICRTWKGNHWRGWSKYALTWLSITNASGLILTHFKANAWRDFTLAEKKSAPPKVIPTDIKNECLPLSYYPKSDAMRPPKSEDYVFNTNIRGDSDMEKEAAK